MTPIGAIASVNPPSDESLRQSDDVSFVPMARVSEETGHIDLAQVRPYRDVRQGLRPFRNGDVLFAKITPSMENGKSAVAEALQRGHGLGSTEFHVIRPGPDLNPHFLRYYLSQRSFREEARKHMTGTAGQLRVPARFLVESAIPFPPITEQERIIGAIDQVLSRLYAGGDALRQSIARLDGYWASYLAFLFGDLERRAPRREAFEFVTSGSRGWARYYADSGMPFIRMGNLQRRRLSLDLNHVQLVELPVSAEGKRTRLTAGDLLISITADLGMIGIVPPDLGEAFINQHIALGRVFPYFDPRFLGWYLVSPRGQRELTRSRRGATKAGLGLEDIRSMTAPHLPLAEQAAVIAQIDRQKSVEEGMRQELAPAVKRTDSLREAILQAAFSGRL